MFKSKKTSLAEVKIASASLVLERTRAIADGSLTLDELEITISDRPRQNRRPDEGPEEHNMLAQAILDNTPGSALRPRDHSFLSNMMSYADITKAQHKYLTDLASKHLILEGTE